MIFDKSHRIEEINFDVRLPLKDVRLLSCFFPIEIQVTVYERLLLCTSKRFTKCYILLNKLYFFDKSHKSPLVNTFIIYLAI